MWKSLSGRSIEDIVREVRELVGDRDRAIHVGTDARHRGYHTDYVTVIAVLDPGNGGRVYYRRQRFSRARSLAHKLFREAELSLTAAQALNGAIGKEIVVHVDANEDVKHRSAKYVQALAGMVVGFGFKVLVKPHAWCASHVADYVVKEKHLKAA